MCWRSQHTDVAAYVSVVQLATFLESIGIVTDADLVALQRIADVSLHGEFAAMIRKQIGSVGGDVGIASHS
jgi:hypothetical protein